MAMLLERAPQIEVATIEPLQTESSDSYRVKRIKENPLNVRVLEEMAMGTPMSYIPHELGLEDLQIFSLKENMRRLMGNARCNTEMVVFALDNGILDAEEITNRHDFNKYIALSPEDKTVFKTIVASKNWSKSHVEIESELGVDYSLERKDYDEQLSRIYAALDVRNTMQLRIYKYLHEAEINKDSEIELLRLSNPQVVADVQEPKFNKESPRPLSKREIQVLELKILGFENSAIAVSLGIGSETVKEHVKHITHRNGRNESIFDVALPLIDQGVLSERVLSTGMVFEKYQEELTTKEREALVLLAENPKESQATLAGKMDPPIEYYMFKKHVGAIIHKLGVRSDNHAILFYHLMPDELREEAAA